MVESRQVQEGIRVYLENCFAAMTAGTDIPMVAFWDMDFNSIVTGDHPYPAASFLELRRSAPDSYFTAFSYQLGIAVRCEDRDALSRWAQAYGDCMEEIVRSDCTLGGNVVDVTAWGMENYGTPGLRVVFLDLTVLCDRGGFSP